MSIHSLFTIGMQNIAFPSRAAETAVQTTREVIHEPSFSERHRVHKKCFVRRRKLTFVHVRAMLLQKTVRSIQLHLHDFFGALSGGPESASASSWCEARIKL